MARQRRPSPTNKEIERMAEAINNIDISDEIQDRDSFDSAFDDYFEEDNQMQQNENVKDKAFTEIRRLNPDISPSRIFKKAKGKDLEDDRRQTAKHIVKTRKEYKKRGAGKVDLEGYDVKTKRRRKLDVVGRVKKRVVYTSKEYVKVKGVSIARHRDRYGRFASIKRK